MVGFPFTDIRSHRTKTKAFKTTKDCSQKSLSTTFLLNLGAEGVSQKNATNVSNVFVLSSQIASVKYLGMLTCFSEQGT